MQDTGTWPVERLLLATVIAVIQPVFSLSKMHLHLALQMPGKSQSFMHSTQLPSKSSTAYFTC